MQECEKTKALGGRRDTWESVQFAAPVALSFGDREIVSSLVGDVVTPMIGKAVGGDDENATKSAINDDDVVTLAVDNGTITGATTAQIEE